MSILTGLGRNSVRLCALGLAMSLGSISAARAQEGSPDAIPDAFEEAQEVVVLTVPFNPPLGQPLAYTVIIEKKRAKGDSRMELEQELIFEALGEGYLLNLNMRVVIVDNERIELSDATFLDALPAAARPYLMSAEIELDPSGEPIRMRDWEAKRRMLQGLPQMTVERMDEDEREGAMPVIRMLFDPLIASTAEEATYAIVKGWPSILGYGGLELEEAELYGSETQMDVGLLGPLSADVELSLSRTEDGDFRFLQTTRPNSQSLLDATTALVRRITEMKGDEHKPIDEQDLSNVSLTMSDDLDVVFEKGTGIPVSAVITRTISTGESSSRGDIITITRRPL